MEKNKKFKYDGRSRPSDNKYRKRWNEIFKKEKTLHEELMKGFEEEQKLREEEEDEDTKV